MRGRILPGWNQLAIRNGNYTGDCMEYAMAACFAAHNGVAVTVDQVNSLVQDMQAKGVALSNGATNMNACIAYAHEAGYPIEYDQGYAEPFPDNPIALLREYAGKFPIVLNVANGRALVDDWKHTSDESNLNYHGIAVLGILDNGDFVCMDDDNPQVYLGRYAAYSPATMLRSRPCGMLVIG